MPRCVASLSVVPMQMPDISNYTMVNRTYRYYDGETLFPFGFGLSYSNFSFSDLEVDPSRATGDDNITVTVTITNNGPYDAEEVTWIIADLSHMPR